MPDASTEDQLRPLVEFARALRAEGDLRRHRRHRRVLPGRRAARAGRPVLGRPSDTRCQERGDRDLQPRLPQLLRHIRADAEAAAARTAPPPRHDRSRRREPEGETGDASPPTVALASRIELLRRKSFDRCTPEELAELAALARGFARALPRRRSRRRRPPAPGRSTCRARSAARSVPAASRSTAAIATAVPHPAGSSCSSMSPARWRSTRGRCCPCALDAPATAADRGLLLRDAAHVDDARPRRLQPDEALRRAARRSSTGRAARGSARR